MGPKLPLQIDETSLVTLLVRPERRSVLLFVIGERKSAREREAFDLVARAARTCVATPQELQAAVAALEAEGTAVASAVLAELVLHPDLPTALLERFAREGQFVSALGHRGGPRSLLELLAEKHRHPEAITTLALKYLGAPGEPLEPFEQFLERHRDVVMLGLALQRAPHLDPTKRQAVQRVFGDVVARRLARRRGRNLN